MQIAITPLEQISVVITPHISHAAQTKPMSDKTTNKIYIISYLQANISLLCKSVNLKIALLLLRHSINWLHRLFQNSKKSNISTTGTVTTLCPFSGSTFGFICSLLLLLQHAKSEKHNGNNFLNLWWETHETVHPPLYRARQDGLREVPKCWTLNAGSQEPDLAECDFFCL